MSLAELVKPTLHATPPRIVIHGQEKIGKSTFAATAPNPVFIQAEDGLTGISTNALPLLTNYQDALDQIGMLCLEDHEYKTVVLDTATSFERLIHDHVCLMHGETNIELCAGGYGKGYLEAMNLWRSALRGLDYLNKEKGMIVVIICHSRVVTINDPLGEGYDSYLMRLHDPKSGNGSASLLKEWSDILLFANLEIFRNKVQGKSKGKDDKERRATTTGRRVVYTQPSPAFAAGSRYVLPEMLELNFESLTKALANT